MERADNKPVSEAVPVVADRGTPQRYEDTPTERR